MFKNTVNPQFKELIGRTPSCYIRKFVISEGINRYKVLYQIKEKILFAVGDILSTKNCVNYFV